MGDNRTRRIQTYALHRFIKQLAIFRLVDRLFAGPYHLHAMRLQHTFTGQIQSTVECRLAAHGGQQSIGALYFNNTGHGLPFDGLDIGCIGHCRVGHNSGGVGVHQNDPVAFLAQRLAGLRTRVIKLAGLTNNNRACTEDQNAFYVSTLRHSGLLLLGPCSDQFNKVFEQRRSIMRSRASFRVTLEAEGILIGAMHSLQTTVEKRRVGNA